MSTSVVATRIALCYAAYMSLANYIDARGLKRSWLAAQIGVTRSTMTRYVSGEWPIPYPRLSLLARVLKTTPIELQLIVAGNKRKRA